MKEGTSETPEGWPQTMAIFIAPLKPLARACLVVFLETFPAWMYGAHSFRPQNGPCDEATFDAIAGFTGHTCCELPFNLKMFRGAVVDDKTLIRIFFVSQFYHVEKSLWAPSVCAGLPKAT